MSQLIPLPSYQVVPNIELPRTRSMPLRTDPRDLIIMSKPKVGKTSLLSELPNCLILDLEDGTDYMSAMHLKAHSIEDIQAIGTNILAQGRPYSMVAIDTLSKLEDMCIPFAERLYAETPQGKNWFSEHKAKYGSILNLPNGTGHGYLRVAFDAARDYIRSWSDHLIQIVHLKTISLNKDGAEVDLLDMDLTGKIKRMTAAGADAIGYLYRSPVDPSFNVLSFLTKDTVACGARPQHLSNAEFVISKKSDSEYTTYWQQIYPQMYARLQADYNAYVQAQQQAQFMSQVGHNTVQISSE